MNLWRWIAGIPSRWRLRRELERRRVAMERRTAEWNQARKRWREEHGVRDPKCHDCDDTGVRVTLHDDEPGRYWHTSYDSCPACRRLERQ